MNIVSLNVCGGSMWGPLVEFIKTEAPRTDIFCFQEVFKNDLGILEADGARMNLFAELLVLLPDFIGNFAPTTAGRALATAVDPAVELGEAMFVRKNFEPQFTSHFIERSYNELIWEDGVSDCPVLIQSVTVTHAGQLYVVAHLHGVALPGHKKDTPVRLRQSEEVAAFVRAQSVGVVVVGDFNLSPDTRSIRLLEEVPLRNLIKEYSISSTRPKSHLQTYPPELRQQYADYAFVSPSLTVRSFTVSTVVVSDHLPLLLDVV